TMKVIILITLLLLQVTAYTNESACRTAEEEVISSQSLNLDEVFDELPARRSLVYFAAPITKTSMDRLIARIERAIERNENEHKEIFISLASLGGNVQEALRVVKYIKERNQDPNISIHTEVASFNSCESACTILYTAGKKRF